mmetsp:Transcript_1443/g.2894  ORF Transcript_1443/g.2894 Transcript_1443/m.2894 type:complete len:200 (+) Transcript_1443:326-925(+)
MFLVPHCKIGRLEEKGRSGVECDGTPGKSTLVVGRFTGGFVKKLPHLQGIHPPCERILNTVPTNPAIERRTPVGPIVVLWALIIQDTPLLLFNALSYLINFTIADAERCRTVSNQWAQHNRFQKALVVCASLFGIITIHHSTRSLLRIRVPAKQNCECFQCIFVGRTKFQSLPSDIQWCLPFPILMLAEIEGLLKLLHK